MIYSGSCHCGNISFNFEHDIIDQGVRCNCSICIRKGAIMTKFTKAMNDVNITIKHNALATYTFATHQVKHHFCQQCGIYTFHESMVNKAELRFNLGCFENLDVTQLQYEIYNGAAI